jgi:ubiquinone/menaquinone biosynthesis C-methylase UbiE
VKIIVETIIQEDPIMQNMSHDNSSYIPKQKANSIFYNGRFYDLIFASSYRHAIQSQDVDFWRSIIKIHGEPVLELACGTGRIAATLAAENLSFTGIDISDSMLRVAQAKSRSVQWVQGDVRNFELNTQFPLIIFPYDTLTHLHTFQDVSECLNCIRRHLEPGGHFMIDLKNPYYVFDILQNPDRIDPYSRFRDPDNESQIEVKRKRHYDPWTQIHTMTLMFYRNQVKFARENLRLRIFYPQEILKILQDNHFQVVQTWGNYQGDFYDAQSSHLILDCQTVPLA